MMKQCIYIFLLTIICLCVWSCSEEDSINSLDPEQSEDILLSHVKFEDNQYVFELTPQEVLMLNVDEISYQKFMEHMNEVNERLREAKNEEIEIIYVGNENSPLIDDVQNLDKINTRSFSETYITGAIESGIFEASHTSTNYCDQLNIYASSEADFWELQVTTTNGGRCTLTGTKNLSGSGVINNYSYLPQTWGVQLYRSNHLKPIHYTLSWTNTMGVHIYDDFGLPLPAGFRVNAMKEIGTFQFSMINETPRVYNLKLTKWVPLDIVLQRDIQPYSTMTINLPMGTTYTLQLLNPIDHVTEEACIQINANDSWQK
jgi:hypothetical protein